MAPPPVRIGAELRWRLFQRLFDGADDTLQWFLQSLENFIAVQCERARHTFRKITAFHRNLENFLAGKRGTDFVLDAFCCCFTDQDAVVAAHIVGNRLVESVTTYSD